MQEVPQWTVLAESTLLQQMLWGGQGGLQGSPSTAFQALMTSSSWWKPHLHYHAREQKQLYLHGCLRHNLYLLKHFPLYPFLCLFCTQHKGEDSPWEGSSSNCLTDRDAVMKWTLLRWKLTRGHPSPPHCSITVGGWAQSWLSPTAKSRSWYSVHFLPVVAMSQIFCKFVSEQSRAKINLPCMYLGFWSLTYHSSFDSQSYNLFVKYTWLYLKLHGCLVFYS